MRVQATKTMAAEINKFFKTVEKFNGYFAKWKKSVDFWGYENNIITIYYPYEFFAMPNELDTNDLLRIFKNSNKTYNGFFEKLLDEIEI
jgi:hypothetical protein